MVARRRIIDMAERMADRLLTASAAMRMAAAKH
jgi:hypothetical protein